MVAKIASNEFSKISEHKNAKQITIKVSQTKLSDQIKDPKESNPTNKFKAKINKITIRSAEIKYPTKNDKTNFCREIALAIMKSISLLSNNLATLRQTKIASPAITIIRPEPAMKIAQDFASSTILVLPTKIPRKKQVASENITPMYNLLRSEVSKMYFIIDRLRGILKFLII